MGAGSGRGADTGGLLVGRSPRVKTLDDLAAALTDAKGANRPTAADAARLLKGFSA